MGDGHGAEDVYLSVGLTQVVYGGSACMCYNARVNLRVPDHCNLQWRRGSLYSCLGCVWTDDCAPTWGAGKNTATGYESVRPAYL